MASDFRRLTSDLWLSLLTPSHKYDSIAKPNTIVLWWAVRTALWMWAGRAALASFRRRSTAAVGTITARRSRDSPSATLTRIFRA